MGAYSRFLRNFASSNEKYSNPKSFVNFLLPPRTRGEGWGGVKNLRLLQELLYRKKPSFISHIMSGRATAIFVGEGSPTIPANN
jgi:hypothetical protein